MEPRSLKSISNKNASRKKEVLLEGMQLLAEHVETLRKDIVLLAEEDRRRSATILDQTASEEAAKILILLDIFRGGLSKSELVSRQIKRFYDHLSRCIYTEHTSSNPATLSDLKRYIYTDRETYYYDGPNGDDWIFRNELLRRREEAIYVDYIRHSDHERWVTPAQREQLDEEIGLKPYFRISIVVDLVIALDRLGCFTCEGLDTISSLWHTVTLTPKTHWHEVEKINRSIVQNLIDSQSISPKATKEDVKLAIDRWMFPLGEVEIEEIKLQIKKGKITSY